MVSLQHCGPAQQFGTTLRASLLCAGKQHAGPEQGQLSRPGSASRKHRSDCTSTPRTAACMKRGASCRKTSPRTIVCHDQTKSETIMYMIHANMQECTKQGNQQTQKQNSQASVGPPRVVKLPQFTVKCTSWPLRRKKVTHTSHAVSARQHADRHHISQAAAARHT